MPLDPRSVPRDGARSRGSPAAGRTSTGRLRGHGRGSARAHLPARDRSSRRHAVHRPPRRRGQTIRAGRAPAHRAGARGPPPVRRRAAADPRSDASLRVVFLGNDPWSVPTLEALAAEDVDVDARHHEPSATRRSRLARLRPRPSPTPQGSSASSSSRAEGVRVGAGHDAHRASRARCDRRRRVRRAPPARCARVPRLGTVNLHFSLLPRWRGAAPVQRAILEGDETTGVSVMLLDEGLDTGPVLATLEEPIRAGDDAGTPRSAAGRARRATRGRVAPRARCGRGRRRSRRITTAATYAAKLSRPRSGRSTGGDPADSIVRRVRAFAPAPGRDDDVPWSAAQGPPGQVGESGLAARGDRSPVRCRIDPTVRHGRRGRGHGRAARGRPRRTHAHVRRRLGTGARLERRGTRAREADRSHRRARGDPPGHRRRRLLDHRDPRRPPTFPPGRARSCVRDRARLRHDPPSAPSIDWALDRVASRPVARMSPSARTVLRLGAYQLLFTDVARTPLSARRSVSRATGSEGS